MPIYRSSQVVQNQEKCQNGGREMMKHNLNGHHRLFQTLYLVAKMAETE